MWDRAVWAQVCGGGQATVNASSRGAADTALVGGCQRDFGPSGRPAGQREDRVAPELLGQTAGFSGLSVAGAAPEMWSRWRQV